MVEARGWAEKFEKLMRLVPGMKGYQDKEAFRDSDKAVRLKISENLGGAKKALDSWKRDIIDSGSIKGLDLVDRAVRKIEELADRVKYESYGYSGYFDAAKIREPELDQLYKFDLGLFEMVDNIVGAVETARSAGAGDIRGGVNSVEASLRELEDILKERHSFEPPPPPG